MTYLVTYKSGTAFAWEQVDTADTAELRARELETIPENTEVTILNAAVVPRQTDNRFIVRVSRNTEINYRMFNTAKEAQSYAVRWQGTEGATVAWKAMTKIEAQLFISKLQTAWNNIVVLP